MAVTGVTTTPQASTSAGSASGMMGKDQFLKLLVTQLANQDPLSPMQGTEFVAQLAQFSSLEQQVNMTDQLQALALAQTAAIGAQAVSFAGKTVLAKGGAFKLDGTGSDVNLDVDFGAAASSGTLTVTDASGNVVATRDLGPEKAGRQQITFDGKDKDGNPLPAGTYTFSVAAKDGSGAAVNATALTRGVVEAVSYTSGAPRLKVDGREVALGDVMEVAP